MPLRTPARRWGSRRVQPLPATNGPADPRIALVLLGGGARSAYQVGVLKAIAQWCPPGQPLPFRLLCGTSAGAVIAAVLAGHAARFHGGVAALERVWRNFHVGQIFRDDRASMLRSGLHLLLSLASGGWLLPPPRSLLDNAPLRSLIEWSVNLARIRQALEAGTIDALAVTATRLPHGESVSFVQSAQPLQGWQRSGRCGIPVELTHDHLAASAAIPFLFPAVHMAGAWYGDGAMRQVTPLSTAVRLGAERVLVIGVREPGRRPMAGSLATAPSLGQMFGFMLDTLFMETLQADVERLQRINALLDHAAAAERPLGLRHVETLMVLPRADLSNEASRYVHEMPRTARALLRVMGAANPAGGQLASYLLFERGYTRRLMQLGLEDATARRSEIGALLGLGPASDQEQRPQPQ